MCGLERVFINGNEYICRNLLGSPVWQQEHVVCRCWVSGLYVPRFCSVLFQCSPSRLRSSSKSEHRNTTMLAWVLNHSTRDRECSSLNCPYNYTFLPICTYTFYLCWSFFYVLYITFVQSERMSALDVMYQSKQCFFFFHSSYHVEID